MFTGLVEEVGRVETIRRGSESVRLTVAARTVLEGTGIGDSLAVAGVCLTVTEVGDGLFEVEMVPETVARTNLLRLRVGDPVNLERSLRLGDRIGGHWVLGHVDGLAKLTEASGASERRYRLRPSGPLLAMLAEKGSVTLDGVSLTVADVGRETFSVAIIPHTFESTTLGRAGVGDDLNLEVDVLARYVSRQLGGRAGDGGRITEEWMHGEGYV